MLLASFTLLLIAAASGGVLAMLGFRPEVPPPAPIYGVLHGCLGAGGFAALLLALRGPPRGVATGAVHSAPSLRCCLLSRCWWG
jgi:hypothetical protein